MNTTRRKFLTGLALAPVALVLKPSEAEAQPEPEFVGTWQLRGFGPDHVCAWTLNDRGSHYVCDCGAKEMRKTIDAQRNMARVFDRVDYEPNIFIGTGGQASPVPTITNKEEARELFGEGSHAESLFSNSRATHLNRANFQATRKAILDYKSSRPAYVQPTPTYFSPQAYDNLSAWFDELKAAE